MSFSFIPCVVLATVAAYFHTGSLFFLHRCDLERCQRPSRLQGHAVRMAVDTAGHAHDQGGEGVLGGRWCLHLEQVLVRRQVCVADVRPGELRRVELVHDVADRLVLLRVVAHGRHLAIVCCDINEQKALYFFTVRRNHETVAPVDCPAEASTTWRKISM